MKKFLKILLGLLGSVLYALMFVVIVAVIELFLYVITVGGILVLWASFSMDRLPTLAQVQATTAMVFYSTMAVSVVLAALAVFNDYRDRKLKASLGNEPQPAGFDPRLGAQESAQQQSDRRTEVRRR